ncbi:hypothetical protein [Defluviitalea phaphyphila]|uniref:hypothetical protein n=1 Tax=Defluviitalea phaphyphila TaxID=1473580 RepID=UPI00072FD957|nr:hypothetical protein [Defluviitalea phaphyphila]
MQEIKYPYFKKGRILKSSMLENLRDYPRDVLEIYNENLSDGIVCGLTPKVEENIITFTKGIIKHNGKLYVLNNPTSITYGETEVEVMIKVNFYDELKDHDYLTQYIEIEIDQDMNLMDNQKELGRFKLKKGAYLRSNYQDLYDFTTEYNTINIVNVEYSGYKEPTISNTILKYFARQVMACRTQNPLDINFAMLCLNSTRIEREVIYNYISYKLGEEIKSLTNKEIHSRLVKILDMIKKENPISKTSKVPGRKIILD